MEYHKHFRLDSMLRYITFTLFIATTISAETLIPNYDDATRKIIFFDSRLTDPLLLKCDSPSGNHELTWQKDGTNVADDKNLKDRYEINKKENNLIIKNTNPEDAGKYTCSLPDKSSAEINVVANAWLKKNPDHMSVVEGEKLKIHCIAIGTDPQITWMIGNTTEFNDTHVSLKDDGDIKDAILIIESAELSDRNNYTCTVTNQATGYKGFKSMTEWTYVRVKGKLAALWPFLGICAEVIILCAIILVYEKRRNKEGLDESDTDQSPEQEKLKTGK